MPKAQARGTLSGLGLYIGADDGKWNPHYQFGEPSEKIFDIRERQTESGRSAVRPRP
jgi:hypothetical protein